MDSHKDFQFPGITHRFFNRSFTSSTHKYTIKEDIPEAEVISNIKALEAALGGSIALVNQKHTNICIIPEGTYVPGSEIEADALATNKIGLAIGVQTADCVPVLFADPKNKIIGAAHAGWRGAFSGILDSTIEKMKGLGAQEGQISALVGPCIHQKSYEVDSIFRNKFLEQDVQLDKFFIPSVKEEHFMFDLPGYVIARLNSLGLKNVEQLEHDTCAMPELYGSYRRACLEGKNGKYGTSLMSTIMIKE